MSVVHAHRQASIDEIAAEMDRRGAVIESLEAKRNLYKGKYRALLKLINKTCATVGAIIDHIEDEGDRRYFGSTNDADMLRDLHDDMDSWVWDALDKHNRMKTDPYADIREQRTRAENAEATIAALKAENERLREALEPFSTNWADENGWTENACQKDRIVDWFGPSDFRAARAALTKQEGGA